MLRVKRLMLVNKRDSVASFPGLIPGFLDSWIIVPLSILIYKVVPLLICLYIDTMVEKHERNQRDPCQRRNDKNFRK